MKKKDTWHGNDHNWAIFLRDPDNHREVAHAAALVKEQYPWMTTDQAEIYEILSRFRGEMGDSERKIRYLYEAIMHATGSLHCASCDMHSCEKEKS